MEFIGEYLPILIPFIIIIILLLIFSLYHIFKHDKYKYGNRIIWILIVVCIQIIGPILYFTIGKDDD